MSRIYKSKEVFPYLTRYEYIYTYEDNQDYKGMKNYREDMRNLRGVRETYIPILLGHGLILGEPVKCKSELYLTPVGRRKFYKYREILNSLITYYKGLLNSAEAIEEGFTVIYELNVLDNSPTYPPREFIKPIYEEGIGYDRALYDELLPHIERIRGLTTIRG